MYYCENNKCFMIHKRSEVSVTLFILEGFPFVHRCYAVFTHIIYLLFNIFSMINM